jgi:hypothetical protein
MRCMQQCKIGFLYGAFGEMLPRRGTLIYMRFWEGCQIWAAEFGVNSDFFGCDERTLGRTLLNK